MRLHVCYIISLLSVGSSTSQKLSGGGGDSLATNNSTNNPCKQQQPKSEEIQEAVIAGLTLQDSLEGYKYCKYVNSALMIGNRLIYKQEIFVKH